MPPPDLPLSASVIELFALEPSGADVFTARVTGVTPSGRGLYGGQVAAQARRAAGLTVEPDRLPHSLHGYFLRGGDASVPTTFHVDRDRDGRSFSARRVTARQHGEVIFSAAASFHLLEEGGFDAQVPGLPSLAPPDELPDFDARLASIESRAIRQEGTSVGWPMNLWLRCREQLPPEPLLQACVLAYVSDLSTGLIAYVSDEWGPGASVDHALWFHRTVSLNDWLRLDVQPVNVSRGRGLYTGSISAADGTRGVTIQQEALFRRRR